MKKIVIVGAGYVGLSLAVLLSQENEVTILDIVKEKIDLINKRISPISDEYIEEYFSTKNLNLVAKLNEKKEFLDADFIIIATPTNFDIETNKFNTRMVDFNIEEIRKINKDALIIIKSTIPIGYTEKVRKKYDSENIIFIPEFLRESKALYDNLYPSRIIIGTDKSNDDLFLKSQMFAELLKEASLKEDVTIKFMGFREAESVKLFSNVYLAMRIGFFNELDTYAELHHLNSKEIIEGVCLDSRIGMHYNNPSFGYGGYCLPKDTKQLLANYENVPQNLISAIIDSNNTRKNYISNYLIDLYKNTNKVVGIYRIVMKSDSDNFRESAIYDVIDNLKSEDIEIIIYEPTLNNMESIWDCKIERDFDKFKNNSDIIIANRYSDSLSDVRDKIYTRDLFGIN